MSSQEAVDFVDNCLKEQQKAGNVCLSSICEQVSGDRYHQIENIFWHVEIPLRCNATYAY